MRLTIELNSKQEEQLLAAARTEGLDVAALAQRLVTEHLPELPQPDRGVVAPARTGTLDGAQNEAAIALLQSWLRDDATTDPEAIREAEQELEELKQHLNANRRATGERRVFPDAAHPS